MIRCSILLGIMALMPPLIAAQDLPAESNDPQLITVRRFLAAGNLKEAEQTVRQFLSSHDDSADAHELLGYILFKQNDPKPSLAEYISAGRLRPLGAPEFEVMGCDYFLLENYALADEWLSRSIESGNKNALASYLLGRTKYNERRFEEAASSFRQSLALDSKNIKAQTNLGRAYEQLGRTEDALAAYRAAVALNFGSTAADPDPYMALGSLLTETNQPAEALPFLIKAAQLAPDQPQYHRQLGKAYLALQQPAAARSELETAIHLDPQSAPAHFLLAQAYQKLGMTEQARSEQARYVQLSGNHSAPDDPLSEARSLVESGQLPTAEQLTRRYLDLHKNSADGHYLLGYILFKRQDAKASLAEYTEGARYRRPTAHDLEVVAGDYVLLRDYRDADKWFTKSVEWDPANWQALYYLGRTKYNENLFDEAVKIFTQCLESEPKSVKAEDNLGLSLEGLGRTDEAIAAYRNAISWQNGSANQDSGPYLDLGALLVTNDRSSDALPYLQQALAIAPQDVRVHRELGKAYMHLNKLDHAEAELEKSVQLAPNDAPTHFILAQLYRRRGLEEKARVEFERYTTLAATHSTGNSQ
jgi:tetratricopeptide (TPR) repeat protein